MPHGAQIGMQDSNEPAPHQKVEAAKGDERSRIVKQMSSRLLQHSSLFEQSFLQHIAQAGAVPYLFEDLLQGFAPLKRCDVGVAENRL